MSSVRVAIGDLAVHEAVAFTFQRGRRAEEGFVLRLEGSVVAFVNRCPHWDVDLDLGFGDPFDSKTGYVRCRNHGALFDARNGRCVAGPCAGQYLEMLPVTVQGNVAIVGTPLPVIL